MLHSEVCGDVVVVRKNIIPFRFSAYKAKISTSTTLSSENRAFYSFIFKIIKESHSFRSSGNAKKEKNTEKKNKEINTEAN